MKNILKPLDYIFILRPTLFFPVWALFLSGYYIESRVSPDQGMAMLQQINPVFKGREFLVIGLFLTVLMGAIFILHQVNERHKKKENDLISSGFLSPKAAFMEAVVLLIIAIIFGFILSITTGLIFLLLVVVAGYLFNFSPFNWKDKSILSLFTILLGAVLIFSSGWLIHGSLSDRLFSRFLPYLSETISVFLFAAIHGYLVRDENSDKQTFVDQFGIKVIAGAAIAFSVISVVIAFYQSDELIFYPSFFALPFVIWAGFRHEEQDVVRAIKFPIYFFIFSVCVKWNIVFSENLIFYLFIGLYVLTRVYYKLRLGVSYTTVAI